MSCIPPAAPVTGLLLSVCVANLVIKMLVCKFLSIIFHFLSKKYDLRKYSQSPCVFLNKNAKIRPPDSDSLIDDL